MKNKTLDCGMIKYIILVLIITVLFIIFNGADIKTVENLMQLTIAAFVFCYIYNKKTDTKSIIELIIIAGIIMRIGYMLYTPMDIRGHDFSGHLDYIKCIMNGGLPDNNGGQFYHPPFFHFLSAIMAKTIGSIKYDGDQTVEAAKIISCFASCVILIVTHRITQEFKLKKGTVIAMALTAFMPNSYLLAGRVNNDALSIMFIYITILYTIRWYKAPCLKNIICIALSIGFGMMTKISAGTMAFFTGPIMLYVLYKNFRKDKRDMSVFNQLCVFALICFPLGLWYGIRNLILFDQAFNYVLRPSEDLAFYFGKISIFKRFIEIPLISGLKQVYHNPWEEYNVWISLLKGGLFGEFIFDINDFIPRTLTIINIFIVIFSTVGIVYTAVSKKVNGFLKYVVIAVWLIVMVSYISINITHPFGCTLDFRYVVPLLLVSSLSSGLSYDLISEKENRAYNILLKLIDIIFMALALCSVIMFTTIN